MENLRLERRGGLVLAAFAGELANEKVPALRREMDAVLKDPACHVLALDLAGVTFLDSSGIGLLVSLATRGKAAGRAFVLFAPSLQARKTLELVRLIGYFQVVEDEAALEGLAGLA